MPFIAYFFYALIAFVGIGVLFLLFVLGTIALVLMAIFFRVFSVRFLQDIAPEYDFFNRPETTPPLITG